VNIRAYSVLTGELLAETGETISVNFMLKAVENSAGDQAVIIHQGE
jgi:hypothetical protein